MKKRMLLVEDEPGLLVMVKDRLEASGYAVTCARTGVEGLTKALDQPFDLILLDIMLPEKDGLTVCRELRENGIGTPILMLTALDGVVDRVVGLRIGADDYLVKPFEMIELLARIEALLRRSGPPPHSPFSTSDPFTFGNIEVRFREALVFRDGEPVHFTNRMFDLLRLFIHNQGTALSRNELLDGAWGQDAMPSPRTVDVHVAWLRQRIEENPSHPEHLVTVRGIGYRFVG